MSTVGNPTQNATPARRRRDAGRHRLALVAAVLGVLAGTLSAPFSAAAASSAPTEDTDAIYLVTLRGSGVAGYRGSLPRSVYRSILLSAQDTALDRIGAGEPLYRWTTALNGFALRLTPAEADVLAEGPGVVDVEQNSVRPLAGGAGPAETLRESAAGHGGAGAVLGVVDSGIHPESPLFATVPDLDPAPRRFAGTCERGAGWERDDCNRKLLGARWFVQGFGEQNLRSSSSLSARDDIGHGTQMASIAAGNAEVSVRLPGQRSATYGGVAPQARIAVYKACWAAPDPADDGCATADLVTAIDQATADGVDVLNLSVGGPAEIDTVERALLGAAERDIVVIGAAGNGGHRAYAAHSAPWVTSIGGVSGDLRRGRVSLPDGPTLDGAMAATSTAGPARLVVGAEVAADQADPADAARCLPGSLDASRTAGAIVLCERGGAGRVEKSEAVDRADGVGMVLVNVHRGRVESDLHSVPTVHLTRRDGRTLRRWHDQHPLARVTLSPRGIQHAQARVTPWSTSGDPTGPVVKPDLVAPAVGVLGAVPPGVRDTRWDFATGTSVAAAWTSGLALRLRGRHDWPADRVRSALVTSAAGVSGSASVLREGAGRPDPTRAERQVLAYRVHPGDYRSWLEGDLSTDALNPASILLTDGDSSARRRITNVSDSTVRLAVRVTGFARHTVTVSPSTINLRPGRSATFHLRVSGPSAGPVDDGLVTWESASGSHGRLPVAITR